ncbi:complex I intermediate-associated protein [Xylariaceae sp. FL0662B]|nr:complex I intermediate-associated protein [Xylariaceae sp. FL0662B]
MRSQLTRHVLRRLPPAIILPRPIFRTFPVGCRVARTPQRRTFFKLFQKPPRTLKEIDTVPGYGTMLRFRAAENHSIRPPSPAELVKAWRQFFGYKSRYGRPVNSTQAMCAHRVLLHLCNRPNVDQDVQLSEDDLRTARECLSKPPRDSASHHLELSKDIYTELRRRSPDIQTEASTDTPRKVEERIAEHTRQAKDFYALLAALSQYGSALEARDLLWNYYRQRKGTDVLSFRHYVPVLRGLAKEGREEELLEAFSRAKKAGIDYDPAVHGIMTVFFAQRDRIPETKLWFNKPISKDLPPAPTTYYEILKFALRNDQTKWAMEIYESLITRLESGPLRGHKPCWDTSFQWAILLLGKGIDHIEHMLKVALEKTQDRPNSQPNIGSINSLIRVAIDKNDPYLAERFIALSKKMGFEPNFKTWMLQLEYRIRANDLDGAFAAYQSLQNQEETTKDKEFPVLNSLIRALCSAPDPNYERVLDITSYLEQRRVTLEPETVVSICMAFLKHDETYEVIDTLSLHTIHYSLSERYMVRKAFVEYCLDMKNSTARAWDAYALLRQFFPEVEVKDRVAIMDCFFDRRRADMASHVFGHMRAHDNARHRPTLDVYVRFLEGIGRCPDEESLKQTHNMLKMDTNIQPNTMLYNALMIGYTACDLPHRALDFWKEITSSPEGPSYNSLEIVFRAYEILPYGEEPADELWKKIGKLEIDVPENVYLAYVATAAAHDNLAKAKTLLEDMDNVVGKRPDLRSLGFVYNAFLSDKTKAEFEAWAEHEYPPAWATLKDKYRRRRDDEGIMVFWKLTRPWKA